MKVESIFLRTGNNYDRDAVSLETGSFNDEPSKTKQSFAEECDINNIVERFGLTGELPSGIDSGQFATFESSISYHEAMNSVVQAREAFMQMPAHVRARFGNDPGAFVDFVQDDANRGEAERLGLVLPPVVEVPPKGDSKGEGTVST